MLEPRMDELPQPVASSRVRPYAYAVKPSEPEGKALEALRLWTQAQADPALTAQLDAWSHLQLAVSLAMQGDTVELEEFTENEPELAHLALEAAQYIKNKAAKLQSRKNKRYQTEGATPDA